VWAQPRGHHGYPCLVPGRCRPGYGGGSPAT
jgi:hypothetical protein